MVATLAVLGVGVPTVSAAESDVVETVQVDAGVEWTTITRPQAFWTSCGVNAWNRWNVVHTC